MWRQAWRTSESWSIISLQRRDGKLFNPRRLQAKTKIMTDIFRYFLLADDCALKLGSEADIQCSVDKFSYACNDFGLTTSIKKTEVLHQPAPRKPYVEPSVTINGQRLNMVKRFTYLGSTLSQNFVIDDEVNTNSADYRAKAWNRRGISLHTRRKVYRAIVLPTLLYVCKTWPVYQRHARKPNHFHTINLRRLLNIKWKDKIPDIEVLAQSFHERVRCLAECGTIITAVRNTINGFVHVEGEKVAMYYHI